jgi:hypothetical protein
MNVVVDSPSDLMDQAFQEVMFAVPALCAHILEEDWNGLPYSSQLALRPHKLGGNIRFVPLEAVSFSHVSMIWNVFPGVSIQGLTLLAYCQSFNYPFYSYDETLLRICAQLNIVQFGAVADKNHERIRYVYMKAKN